LAPARRAQALHASALLVDEHERLIAPRVAELAARARNWAMDWQLRANRMRPQGRASANSARSSSLRAVPAQPEMKALKFTTPG
jgi:hypothetical protein